MYQQRWRNMLIKIWLRKGCWKIVSDYEFLISLVFKEIFYLSFVSCANLVNSDFECTYQRDVLAPDLTEYETKITSNDNEDSSSLLPTDLYILGDEYVPYDSIFPSENRESEIFFNIFLNKKLQSLFYIKPIWNNLRF